jgi:stage V sporulation protein G
MEVTKIRVTVHRDAGNNRLLGFASLTLDDSLGLHDLKIIDGRNVRFVSFPQRKICDHCPDCRARTEVTARFCHYCGAQLNDNRAQLDDQGKPLLWADIVHPVTTEFREKLMAAILAEYDAEAQRQRTAKAEVEKAETSLADTEADVSKTQETQS